MFSWLTQYYGVDLLATAMTFLGIWLLGNKRRSGFILTSSGNVLWLVIGLMIQSSGLLIANLGLVLLNARGYWKWRQEMLGMEDEVWNRIAVKRDTGDATRVSHEHAWDGEEKEVA